MAAKKQGALALYYKFAHTPYQTLYRKGRGN